MSKNLLKLLIADKKTHVIPFTVEKHGKVMPFCIVISTIENDDIYEVSWSRLAYYDENKKGWFWQTDNKPVDSMKGLFQHSIEDKIRNKVDLEYLTN